MQIQGYNRLVKDLAGLSDDRFLELIKTNFIIKELPNFQTPYQRHAFSMYLNGNWYRLNDKKIKFISDDPVAGLDASILQIICKSYPGD
jgi:Uncharacterized conserved protein